MIKTCLLIDGVCPECGLTKGNSPRRVLLCPKDVKVPEKSPAPTPAQSKKPKRDRPHGPGWHLLRLLKRPVKMLKWGGFKLPCNCVARAKVMDKWGPVRCRENIEVILDWLQEEARIQKMLFVRRGARILVVMAIRTAEAEAARKKQCPAQEASGGIGLPSAPPAPALPTLGVV